MCILFTNCKLRSLHSESGPRSRSKASAYSYTQKKEHECMVPVKMCGSGKDKNQSRLNKIKNVLDKLINALS